MSPTNRTPKTVKRYTYDTPDPVTPETGHTDRLVDEEVVLLPMDNGWSSALEIARLDPETSVIVDFDPAFDPVLLWSGKRKHRDLSVLPLQRNEVVSESRLTRIIERARQAGTSEPERQGSLFAELERELRESTKDKRIEFYTHEEQWRNKLICGDSLQVMESLLRYEGAAGHVQMMYIDPPYGIGYNSNFQQRIDTASNDKGDLADDVLTIRAFRDTWSLGIHSYLSHLSERLYVMRDLLASSGSIFFQIGDENVHLVRMLMDEVFGRANFVAQIAFSKTTGLGVTSGLPGRIDYLLWYCKDRPSVTMNSLYEKQDPIESGYTNLELSDGTRRTLSRDERSGAAPLPDGSRLWMSADLTKPGPGAKYEIEFEGKSYNPGRRWWGMPKEAMEKLVESGRVALLGKSLRYIRYFDDFPLKGITNLWTGWGGAPNPLYVVQTNEEVVARCISLTTSPGDLVFDPTCGSGTTAAAAERLGRRWVTCDTSRVATNIARKRLLSSTFPYYTLIGNTPTDGFRYEEQAWVTAKSTAYGLEPERVVLVDHPEVDGAAVRVCGPFEIMTLGRYSLEDWKGSLVDLQNHQGGLENYVETICRLYEPDAEVAGTGIIHALVDGDDGQYGISVGPLTGRITAYQLNEVAKEAESVRINRVHLLGWAFEANVGEVKGQLEKEHGVSLELVMIRPDALADGLKMIEPELLFSPVALPEVEVVTRTPDEVQVALAGVTIFDRQTKRTMFHSADDHYIAAWYLDEDYDGDCFVDCQMFFDFRKAPNLKTIAGVDVDTEEFDIRFVSDPFPVGKLHRIAVKVVDLYGNESTIVLDLNQ